MKQGTDMRRGFIHVALICAGLFALFYFIDRMEQDEQLAYEAKLVTASGGFQGCPLTDEARASRATAKMPLRNGTGR